MASGYRVSLILTASMVLAACTTTRDMVRPADIPPVYKIRNSPLPVPDPKWNPRRHTRVATVSAKPSPKPAVRPTKPKVQTVSGGSHTVRRGDTLYSLSRRYGVPLRSMITANSLRTPYTLAVGQKLRIPSARTHTVKKGDTGYSISRQYGVNVSALMKTNGIRPPYRLAIGQKLKLPGGASLQRASASVTQQAAPSKPQRGRSVAVPTPPPRSKSGFVWPVQGRLASRFGPKEGGLHNDGINILADQGSPVRVADAGVVVYASNALEGYGNLLLVKHAGGWITAYAHNERILVRPGQKVNRGDVVARVGSTGGVSAPQLHFEVRKGRQALDPLRYLPGVRVAQN